MVREKNEKRRNLEKKRAKCSMGHQVRDLRGGVKETLSILSEVARTIDQKRPEDEGKRDRETKRQTSGNSKTRVEVRSKRYLKKSVTKLATGGEKIGTEKNRKRVTSQT